MTCGLALSPLMLIVSRVVQGAGAALVSPSALALLTTTNAEGAERNRALSLWQAGTAAGASTGVIAFALPTASIGATTGMDRNEQGLAGGLLTTSLQMGAAIGLALLATLAAARTAQAGWLAAGYGFSYRVAAGIVALAILLVGTQLNHRACQSELARLG